MSRFLAARDAEGGAVIDTGQGEGAQVIASCPHPAVAERIAKDLNARGRAQVYAEALRHIRDFVAYSEDSHRNMHEIMRSIARDALERDA